MRNLFEGLSGIFTGGTQRATSNLSYSDREMTWDEVFAGVPTAPGTEAAQERHRQLREESGENMTEQEEEELNELFRTIYPQFLPKNQTS